MNIYVSWCYTDKAEDACLRLEEKHTDLDYSSETSIFDEGLPEYVEYSQVVNQKKKRGDTFTENLLGIRFVVPVIGEVQSFKLANRLPGDKKLPVAIAARNWILNTFTGAWCNGLNRQDNFRVTFVGLSGLASFLQTWAYNCAAYSQPLPIDLWRSTPRFELPEDDAISNLIKACAFNQETEQESSKYLSLTKHWLGTGISAEVDSAILMASAARLGFKET